MFMHRDIQEGELVPKKTLKQKGGRKMIGKNIYSKCQRVKKILNGIDSRLQKLWGKLPPRLRHTIAHLTAAFVAHIVFLVLLH